METERREGGGETSKGSGAYAVRKILLVEDQVIIAVATGEKLKKFGYDPVLCHNGEDAVEKIHEHADIALVLMDIDLGPGMNGPEAAKKILETHDVPIIFLTSHREKDYVELVKEITRYGYVIKNSGDFVLESSINMAFELFSAHQNAKEREEKLIHAEATSGFGTWQYSAKTDEIGWSDRIYTIYGIPKGGSAPNWEDDLDMMLPDGVELPPYSSLKGAIHGAQDFQFIYRITNPQKGKRWLSCWGQNMLDKAGNVTGMNGIIQDISLRMEAEYSYRQIFNMSIDLICIADIHTATFIQINPAFSAKLGYTQTELLGKPFMDFIHPDDIEATQRVMDEQLKQNREVISFTNRYRKKDGGYVYLNWNSHPNAEEGVTYAVAHDLTDFILAKERVQHLKRLLESIRTINQSIFKIEERQQLIDDVCRELTHTTGYYHTWIVLFDDERKITNAASFSIDERHNEFAAQLRQNGIPMCIDKMAGDANIRIIENPADECGDCIYNEMYPAGYSKMLCKIAYNGITYGTIGATFPKAYVYDQEERELFFAIVQDISLAMNRFHLKEITDADKRKIEKHLNDYKRLFDAMLDGYAIHELVYDDSGQAVDYRFIDVNPAFEQILGVSREKILGKTVLNVFPQTEKYWIETYANVVKTGTPFTFTNYSQSFGKYFKVTAFSPGPRQFVTIFMDITDQMKSNEELLQQKDLLERIMETSPTGITIVDLDSRITFANRKSEEIFGMSREKIMERRSYDTRWKIMSVDGGEFPNEQLPFSLVTSTGKPVYDIRHGIEIPGGKRIMISVNAAPLKNKDGEMIGVIAAIEDITEWVKSERRINELLKEKELLIKEVHHRVKNDFNIINSLLQLQKDQSASEENRNILDEASSRIAVMSSVYEILFRSDNIHEVNLNHMVTALITNLQNTIIPPHIRVSIVLDDIYVDAKTSVNIGIIVNELLTNAVKYAFGDAGAVTPEIVISAEKTAEDLLVLSVNDNGCGIPGEISDTRKFGFGLFLVDSLVAQHAGTLDISIDSGTRITVSLRL